MDMERMMRGSAITGWGSALPPRLLTNAELAERLDVSEDWILERTGISARHVAGEDQTSGTLATDAGVIALDRAGVDGSDLDMVIVATCTPDNQIPATAPLVQAALGAHKAGAFDVGAGCSGFLYALSTAQALIEGGGVRRALVCGADVLSRVTDYSDARSCVLFGDGAGAAVVEAIEGPSRIGPFILKSDGLKAPLLEIPTGDRYLRMNGREVYRHAVDGMSQCVGEVLETVGMKADELDLLVAHQANARILAAVADRLGLTKDQVVLNIGHTGNTSAASIPIALAEAAGDGSLESDDHVMLAAFGAGFVWGAGLIHWGVGSPEEQEKSLVGAADAG
jgi:3-oxoacyl-[acyl-carrier-protein] synthase-3